MKLDFYRLYTYLFCFYIWITEDIVVANDPFSITKE